MAFDEPPAFAAYRHRDARDGFEVVFLQATRAGHQLDGHTAAVEDGQAWAVGYSIVVDARWATRSAHVVGRSAAGARELRLEADGSGRWFVNGAPAPQLAGCLDVDLESSSVTNTLPVRRLRLEIGQRAEAPAAYVRALDLTVERLEQRYLRTGDEHARQRYDYSARASSTPVGSSTLPMACCSSTPASPSAWLERRQADGGRLALRVGLDRLHPLRAPVRRLEGLREIPTHLERRELIVGVGPLHRPHVVAAANALPTAACR